MSISFYLQDVTHKNVKQEDVVHKDVLFFKQERSGFDGVATRDHVKQNPAEFENFSKAHPHYKLPDSFSEVEIGKPGASATLSAPVQEIAEEKVAKSKKK